MSATFFIGEKSGARILAYGGSSVQVGTDFQVGLRTWDIVPTGPVGDSVFRSVDTAMDATAGYSIAVIPTVDDVDQPEQFFQGADTGQIQAQAFTAVRGTRVSAKIRTVVRTGDLHFSDISTSFVPLRKAP